MIYEINGKPYIKVDNFYAELEVTENGLVPLKDFKKIYDDEINESDLKVYNPSQVKEENKNDSKDSEIKRKNKLI